MSISNYLEDKILDLVFNATAYSGQATVYVALHLGDPGEAGTGNTAAHTTRAAATFGASASGSISNDAAVTWASYSANETVTHISLWDASTAGNCLWTGALTASKALTSGDTFQIAIGSLDVTLD